MDESYKDILNTCEGPVRDMLVLCKKLIYTIPIPNAGKILDIGGSTGRVLEFYFDRSKECREFYIIDICIEALKKARQYGFYTICLDIETTPLPFPDNVFDLIIVQELIEHLISPDNLLAEIERTLKKNGFLLLTTPNIINLHDRFVMFFGHKPSCMISDKSHIRFYTHSDIKNMAINHNINPLYLGTQGVYFPLKIYLFKKCIKIPLFHMLNSRLGYHVILLGKKAK